MVRLEKVYLSQSKLPDLYEEFFRSYDDDYWFAKINMYEHLLENTEEVFEDNDSVDEDDIERYQSLLKAEFHYLFYHSTEALLGLVNSITKDGYPWIDLKEARTQKIDDFVEEELGDDGFKDELQKVFYPGAELRNSEEEELVEESLDFLLRYLRYVGHRYGDRAVYNEYKHGLRLTTSEREIFVEVDDSEGFNEELLELDEVEETENGIRWKTMDDEVLFFLEPTVWTVDEETGKKHWSLARKVKAMEFDLYHRLCIYNAELISQIFDIHRKTLDIDENNQEEVSTTYYENDDLEGLFESENTMTAFSVNSYIPKSEEDCSVYTIQ
jgi:hypothetical protein